MRKPHPSSEHPARGHNETRKLQSIGSLDMIVLFLRNPDHRWAHRLLLTLLEPKVTSACCADLKRDELLLTVCFDRMVQDQTTDESLDKVSSLVASAHPRHINY